MAALSSLASVGATKAILEHHGLWTKHSLGQHFLINDGIVKRIIQHADLSPEESVLEVGPGIGTLTVALLQNARSVFAVEQDVELAPVLEETTAPWSTQFHLIMKDALKLQESDLLGARPRRWVSNLPYNVATALILDYFQRFSFLDRATLMVQKEVADRIDAKPGTKSYGSYSVKLGFYVKVIDQFKVGPNNFFPPPHVDSAVISLERLRWEEESTSRLDRDGQDQAQGHEQRGQAQQSQEGQSFNYQQLVDAACLMADAAFANRRKTLANSCRAYFKERDLVRSADTRSVGVLRDAAAQEKGAVQNSNESLDERLSEIFSLAGIDSRRRGETLSQEEFLALGEAYLRLS